MQQDAHHEATLSVRLDRNRTRATAAARHLVIPCGFPRHFSSPDELCLFLCLFLGLRIVLPE
jgi:hypothetical protein